LTLSFWPHYDLGVNSASNRNDYQGYLLWCKGGWGLRQTTLPPSCADSRDVLGAWIVRSRKVLSIPVTGYRFASERNLAMKKNKWSVTNIERTCDK